MSAGPARRGTSWRRMRLIALRELRERMAQRAYRIALVVGAVLAAAGVAVPTLLDGSGSPSIERVPVAFTDASEAAAKDRAAQLEAAIRAQGDDGTRVRLERESSARRLVEQGGKEYAVIVRGTAADPQVLILGREGGGADPSAIVEGLQRVALEARAEAVASAERDRLLAPLSVDARTVASGGATSAAAAVVGVFGLIVYITGILLMTAYATGIVSDRAGRVTERLLTAAQPQEHLAGKLLGVGAAGILQIAVWFLGGIIAAVALSGSVSDTFAGVPVALLAFFPASILMTYLSYAALATVLVLPVRKTEDVGAALAPATMIQIVTFILASGQVRPGAAVPPLIEALSFVPFCSPLLMLIRIAGGGVPLWEVLASIALTLVAAAAIIRIAAPAYARYAIEAPGGKGLGAALATLRR